MTHDIRTLYDQAAADWCRAEPLLLSDFTARERVFEAIGDIRGLHLWDLGCGEGYGSRRLAALGAQRIDGFDLSEAMVQSAQSQAGALGEERCRSLHYAVADLGDPQQLPQGSCDAALAVFLFNYLPLAATQRLLAHVHHAVRPGGFFLFTVPHPSLAYLRGCEPPFYLDPSANPYMGSSDLIFEGRIWRRDGVANSVRSRHKTVEDYFRLLAASGWQSLPQVEELGVTERHLAIDEAFFGPLRGMPLHLVFLLRR